MNWEDVIIQGNMVDTVTDGTQAKYRAVLVRGVKNLRLTGNAFYNVARAVQIYPWKNSGGGSEYAMVDNILTEEEVELLKNNTLSGGVENFIRWNKTYNVFDKDTVKIPLNETLAPVATVTPTPIPTQKPKEVAATPTTKPTETPKVSEATTPVKAGTVEDGRKYAQENGYTHKIYEYEVTVPEGYKKELIEYEKIRWGDLAGDYEKDDNEIYAEIWSTDSVNNLSDSSRYVIIYHGKGTTSGSGVGFTNPMNNGDSITNDMRGVKGGDEKVELQLKYSDTQDFFRYLDTSRLDSIYVSEGVDYVHFNYEIRNHEMKFIFHSGFKTLPGIDLDDSFTEFTVPEGIESVYGIGGTFLEKIVFPEGVKDIGGCSNMYFLEEINLPDSVEELGGFIDCPKLKQVPLPKNLKILYGGAFEVRPASILNNTRYKSDERLQEVYKLFDCDGREKSKRITAWSEIRLPEGLEYVGVNCFSRYNDVTYYLSKETDTKNWSPEWRDIVDANCKYRKADVILY